MKRARVRCMREPPNDLLTPLNDEERARMWSPMCNILGACPARSVRLVPAIARVVVAVFAMATVSACASEPTSCEEAACDPVTEYCHFFGSDTLAPSTASCVPLPEECAEEPDCECMLAAEGENSIETCDETGDVIVMTEPGG